MTLKASRLAKLHAATDRQTGEQVRIVPQRSGGYVVGGQDPTRAAAEIVAYVARIPGSVRTEGNAANSGHNPQLRMTADTIKYKTSSLPFTAADGDLVELLEEDGAPVFRVSRVSPFGTDRTILFLVKTSR